MNLLLEKQVCSLELAKTLKELGVPQDSIACWLQYKNCRATDFKDGNWHIVLRPTNRKQHDGATWTMCSAFTVDELGALLPQSLMFGTATEYWLNIARMSHGWQAGYVSHKAGAQDGYQTAITLADTLSELIIYLIEQKLLDPKTTNHQPE